MENLPADYFVTSQAFTKTTHRDVYPEINPSTNKQLSQEGKVIVITGASRGIGARGFAKSFALAKPKAVVLVARSVPEAAAKDIAAIAPSSTTVLPLAADVSDAASVDALWKRIEQEFGHADVLVNNAATAEGNGPISGVDKAKWWLDFEINVKGVLQMSQGFLRLLGPDRKGSLITMTTGAAYMVFPGISSYSISKLAALQLSNYIAAENPNVTAVSVHPGVVKTDMTFDSFMKFADDQPELVGGLGVWLTTEKAKFLNGRYVSANWDVSELEARKDEIISKEKLKIDLTGEFGI